MANGDGLDELEYKTLQGAVSRIEALLAYSSPGEHTLYENFLSNARTRLDFLEKEMKSQKEEKESHAREQSAAALSLAQRETALSVGEKKTFSGFLAEEFFTKKDFSRLEQFYSQSWERLSEGGKAEMSHRVWEGIRRDEYKFTDLPEVVQEKEVRRAYSKLTAPAINQSSLAQIPEADRNEFIEAYRSGDHQKAFHVLDRGSFRRNMALESTLPITHKTVDETKEADIQAVEAKNKTTPAPASKPASAPAISSALMDSGLNAVDLKNLKLAEASSPPSAASVPDASGPRVNAR